MADSVNDTPRLGFLNMDNSTAKECNVCGKQPVNRRSLVFCPHCKSTSYCNVEHRKQDWKTHKRTCLGYPVREDINSCKRGETVEEYVVRNLNDKCYCVLDDFHGSELGLSILEEVNTLRQQGSFTDGELVSLSGSGKKDKRIREDQISWVTGKERHCQAIARHMTAVDLLMSKCNLLIKDHDIRNRTKAMVACYPGEGAHYKRHVDNPHKDGRCITTLYYLNQNWTEKNGGILQLYPRGREDPVNVLPILDRLLLFWSDRRNPHEVQPAFQMRYAITLWYFDTEERAKYCTELRRKSDTKKEELVEKKDGVLMPSEGVKS